MEPLIEKVTMKNKKLRVESSLITNPPKILSESEKLLNKMC